MLPYPPGSSRTVVKCAGIEANLWHPHLAPRYCYLVQCARQGGRQHGGQQVGRVVWLVGGMQSAT